MLNKILNKIRYNYVVRNVVLAISIIFILIISCFLFLDIYTKHGEKFIVPNLSGLTMLEAEKVAEPMECRFVIIDSLFIPTQKAGVILEQNPKPGNFIKSNRRVLLTVNTMSPRKISIPYVAGYSLRQAKNKLLGLGIGISNIIFQEDIATNNVIAQNYKGKKIERNSRETIAIGEELELVVGLAPNEQPIKIPNLIGNSVSQAKNTIWESGFNVGSIILDTDIKHDNIENAVIFNQSVLPTILLPHGSKIDIFVTLDEKKVSAMAKKIRTRQNNINKNKLNINKHLDTLNILRAEDGKDTIITIDRIITAQDSTYYNDKLFELELLNDMLMNNLEVKKEKEE